MYRPILLAVVLFAVFQGYESQQIQMPESGALFQPDEDIMAEVQSLQRNISELWTYIYQLRGAVTQHLNHLREHQVELENTVHRIEHHPLGSSDTHAAHTDDHHHSGEHHHHSGEQHSHGNDQHHHSGEQHSHGNDQHHHSGEQHSHGNDQHHHSGENHSHSGEHHSHGGSNDNYHASHSHDSHSHSHTGDAHGAGSHSSHEDTDHHHHHDNKDSHEKEDDLQQTQQGADLVSEPSIVPTQRQSHNHHHHGSHSSIGQPMSSSFKPLHMAHYHHHHDNQPNRNRSRVVVLPKYSEYDLYEFAVCNVQPNRAIPEDQQQEIVGQISLWQKKRGGPLNIHVRVQGFKMGDHHAHHQTQQQEEDNETPSPVSHKHGFHIHTAGDLSNGCQSTGPHYNPKAVTHGGPNALVRHVGDLGNIECDEHGVTNIVFADDVASLTGQYPIVGRSMVIHSSADDYGLGGNEESLLTGNAGTRIACCVIQKVEKLPIRSYKAIKTATHHQN